MPQDLGAEVDAITETTNLGGPVMAVARDWEEEKNTSFRGSREATTIGRASGTTEPGRARLEHRMDGWDTTDLGTPQRTAVGRIGSMGAGRRVQERPTTAVSHAIHDADTEIPPPAIDWQPQLVLVDGGLKIANLSMESEMHQPRSIENDPVTALGDPDLVTASEGRAGLQITREVYREVDEPRAQESSPIVKAHAIQYIGNLLSVTATANKTFSELSLGHDVYQPERTKKPTGLNNLQISYSRIVGQDVCAESAIPRVPSTVANPLEDTRVESTMQKPVVNHAMHDDTNAPNTTTISQLSALPILKHAIAGPDNLNQLKGMIIPLHRTVNIDVITGLDSSRNPMRDLSGAKGTGGAYGRVVYSRAMAVDDGIQATTSTPNPTTVTDSR